MAVVSLVMATAVTLGTAGQAAAAPRCGVCSRGTTLTDDLSAVLGDATYNDDASAGSYAAPKLASAGALAAGTSVAVTYSVT